MRRLSLLLVIILLAITAKAVDVQAYYLDTPHNESNGIFCFACHSGSEWDDPEAYGDGMDLTVANTVCLRCHADPPTGGLDGPQKTLHASSTTSADLGTWSTQCVDCHDAHFQPQLMWAASDTDVILASGTLVEASMVPSGGDTGTTIFSVNSVTGVAPYNDPLKWDAKGGFMKKTRAWDDSRGLIILSNGTPATGDTFEIVLVADQGGGNYDVTVKGNMTSALTDGAFMVFYGAAIKTSIKDLVTGAKNNVKFFTPEIISGKDGGYIDQDEATKNTDPVGLCQVCHTLTTFWDTDGAEQAHNPGTTCSTCHDILTGGKGGANHDLLIVNHLDAVTYSPTTIDCSACHDPSSPDTVLHANADNAAAGTGCQACHDAGETALNADVATRLGVSGTFGDPPAGGYPVACDVCHPGKPAAVNDGSHGGHNNTHFDWDSTCGDCHTDISGNGVVFDVHGDDCTMCHVDPAGGDYTRKAGDPSFGIDGDADQGGSITIASVCTDCHNTNAAAVIHHESVNNLAGAGNCTGLCHTPATVHAGDHTNTIQDYGNCTNCHTPGTIVGGVDGAPVEPLDNKVHDNCLDCHELNTATDLVELRAGSSADGLNGGDVGGTNGGGTCFTCHGEYFASHSNANHSGRVDGTVLPSVDCSSCHTGTAGTGSGIPIDGGDVKVHDDCFTCHNNDGVLKTLIQADTRSIITAMPNGGVGSNNGGGKCDDCHGTYFPDHDTNHQTRVADTTNCNTCHPNTQGLVTGITTSNADNKVHDDCFTCHDSSSGLLMGVAAANNAGTDATVIAMTTTGNCNSCHGAYFVSHKNAAHSAHVQDTTNCNGCHTATAGTATGIPVDPAVNATANKVHDSCATCHDTTTGDLLDKATANINGYILGTIMVAGTCNGCHDAYFISHSNMDHTGKVDGLATCTTTCHDATAGGAAGLMPIAPAVNDTDDRVHDACVTCHNATTGVVSGTTTYGALPLIAGDCGDCHGDTFFDSHLHHTGPNNQMAYNATNDKTTGNSTCATCHKDAAGDFSVWSDIETEHETVGVFTGLNACSTCHEYDINGNRSGLADTPPEGTFIPNIITSGTQVSCVTCHTPKDGPLGHGSHTSGEFAWSPATRVSCGDDGRNPGACHTDDTNTDVILQIHNDNCDNCHVNEPENDYTRKVMIDADATTLAAQTNGRDSICTDCHTTGSHDKPFMHHDSLSFTASTDCATRCHKTENSAEGNHTTLVATESLVAGISQACADCHTGTAGSSVNIPVNDLDDKVHDACTQCHFINTGNNNMVETVTIFPMGVATDMNNGDGTLSTSNGGGTCFQCHTSQISSAVNYFEEHTHVHDVDLDPVGDLPGSTPDESWSYYATCGNKSIISSGCHTDLVGTSGGGDAIQGNWMAIQYEHDRINTPVSNVTKDGYGGSCATCHLSGKANSDLMTYVDVSEVISLGAGTSVQCMDCHYTKRADGNHGMDYVDHFITNDSGQGSLGYPPMVDPSLPGIVECLGCHPTGLNPSPPAVDLIFMHNNSCSTCHFSQPGLSDGSSGTPNLTGNAGGGGYTCVMCHTSSIGTMTWPFHEMAPGNTILQDRHENAVISDGTQTYNCMACHTGMTSTGDKLLRHMPGYTNESDCYICHTEGTSTAPTLAMSVVDNGSEIGGDNPNYCESCHTGIGQYRTHGDQDAEVLGIHDFLGDDSVAGDTNCNKCHTSLATTALRLSVHTSPIDGTGGTCVPCHSQSTGSAPAVITSGVGGTIANCRDCHMNPTDYLMHGLDNASSAGVHNQLAASVNAGSGTATDCAECHTPLATAQNRLDVHPPNCATASCHDATGTAATVINNGWNIGTSAKCEDCHAAKGDYSMHGITDDTVGGEHNNIVHAGTENGTDDDCANCHTMTTGTEMLDMHTNPVKTITGTTGACLDCHTGAAGTLTSVVDAGKSVAAGGSNLPQYCDTCHTGQDVYRMHGMTAATSGAAHNNLVASIAANSTCGSGAGACHTSTTATTMIEVHTLGSIPTKCISCHTSAISTIQSEMNAGFNNVNSTPCEDCHSTAGGLTNIAGDWYLHNDPGHGSLVLDPSAPANYRETCNSASCHGSGGNVAMHDSVPSPVGGKQACMECHSDTSALIDSAIGHAGGGECSTCHDAYFDSHSHTHATYYDPVIGEDLTLSDLGCNDCHTGGLATWNNVLIEHDQNAPLDGVDACATCHDYNGTNGSYNLEPGVTVEGAIATPTGNKCGTCHDDKSQGPGDNGSVFHGGHDAAHFAWDANSIKTCGAFACHSSSTNSHVVDDVHNGPIATNDHGGVTCLVCHTIAGGGDSVLRTYGTWSRADQTSQSGTDAPHTVSCSACHTGGVNTFFDGHLHDHSVELTNDGVDSVPDNTVRTQDCDRCHTSTSATKAFTGGTTHTQSTAGCQSCHLLPLTDFGGPDGTRTSHAADGGNFTPLAPADDCIDCHSAGAPYFDSHTSRGATGSHDGITYVAATDISQDGTAGNSCGDAGCHLDNSDGAGDPLDSWQDILGEHNNDCGLCHNYDVDDTPPLADNYNTIGTPTGNTCITCHQPKSFADFPGTSTHGGHAVTDFAWTGAMETSCGDTGRVAGACHGNGTSNPDVVNDVHGDTGASGVIGRGYSQFSNTCQNCHLTSGGGTNTIGGILENGFVGSALTTAQGGPAATGGAPHSDTCTTCHGSNIPLIHHERNMTDTTGASGTASVGRSIAQATLDGNGTQSNVQNGWCYLCHTDSNYTLNGGGGYPNQTDAAELAAWQPGGPARNEVLKGSSNPNEQRPGITPCAYCHIENTPSEWRIKLYLLDNVDPTVTPRAALDDAPDPFIGTYTHVIPNRGLNIDIVNTGVCLHCHGETSNRPVNYPAPVVRADGNPVIPRHAFRTELHRGDETDPAEVPRFLLGLHPGMFKYQLMATAPNQAAFTNVPEGTNPMNNRNGGNNDKLYKDGAFNVTTNNDGHTAQALGKTGGTINNTAYPLLFQQWNPSTGITALKDYEGENFVSVDTQTVPYTINGGGGPFEVPLLP